MILDEQKILNAIKYFVKNTKFVGRTKLFKLLYYWDFRFFGKHGYSITGFTYKTYPFGPVPEEFYNYIISKTLPEIYKTHLRFDDDSDYDKDDKFKRFKIFLKNKKIDMGVFTGYEKEELDQVAEIFKEATATDMTEATHFKNTPWSRTLEKQGEFKEIDYFLALEPNSNLDNDEIKERMELREMMFEYGDS